MPHLNINIRIVSNAENIISSKITEEIELTIWDCIRNKAKELGIKLDFFYGSSNQRYCIIVLKNDQTVRNVMDSIRGNNNFCKNKQVVFGESSSTELPVIKDEITNHELEWESNIYAMKVNDSVFDRISNYAQNELQINNRKTFETEDEYLIQYSFDEI